MQVSLRASMEGVAVVGFELDGRVSEAMELLAPEQRHYSWAAGVWRNELWDQLNPAMHDPHRGLLGRRGAVWMDFHSAAWMRSILITENGALPPPWTVTHLRDPLTLVQMASTVEKDIFRVPDTSAAGLDPASPLHQAVEQAMLVQAAFRALRLHRKSFPT
jgi:hypothetical protein